MVEDDVAGFQHRAERLPGPAQKCLGAGDQLGHCEGLDQVVIRPGVQAGHPGLDRVAGREHQHGDAVPRPPQLTQQLHPVPVRQPEVEDDGIVGDERHRRAGIGDGRDRVHDEAGPAQGRSQHLDDPHFILDD